MPYKIGTPHNVLKASMVLAMALVIFLCPYQVLGQPQKPSPKNQEKSKTLPAGEIGLEELRANRKAIESSEELGDSVKKSVLSLLDQAIRFRESAAQFERDAEDTEKKGKSASKRIREIEATPQPSSQVPESIDADAVKMGLERLEQKVRQQEMDLSKAKVALREWSDLLSKQANRPQQLRESTAKAKERLLLVQKESDVSKPDDHPLVTKARQEAFIAEQAKCLVEIKTYEQQLAVHDALMSLYTAERDLALKEVASKEIITKAWQAQAQQARQREAAEAKKEASEARVQAENLPPAIQEQFDSNVKLGENLEQLTRQETSLAGKLESRLAQLKALEEEFALARARVQSTVLTETIGLALREQRQNLPNQPTFRRDSAMRQLQMSGIQDEQFKIEQEKRLIADLEKATRELIQALDPVSKDKADNYRIEIKTLLANRQELFTKLQEGYRRHFKDLQDLEFTEQQILAIAAEYGEFLDGHLLWIRSSKVFSMQTLKNLPSALGWFFRPSHWKGVIQDVKLSTKRSPERWVLGIIISLILFALYPLAKKDLGHVAAKVGHVYSDSFVLTLRALLMTFLMAAPWSFLMAFPAWCLAAVPTAYDFTRAFSSAMLATASQLGLWLFFFHTCRKDGLGGGHFKWPQPVRHTLRRNFLWLIPLLVVLEFFVVLYDTGASVAHRDSLGRLAFLAIMLSQAAGAAWILRFSGGIVTSIAKQSPHGWLMRLRYIWYFLALAIPLSEGLFAYLGYGYSAAAFETCGRRTARLLILLKLGNDLILRWFFIAKKRLAWEEHKRKAKEEMAAQDPSGDSVPEEEAVPVKEPEFDLGLIDEQTRSFLRIFILFTALVALWAIWSPMLPGLNVIGDIHLWSYSKEVDGVAQTLPITLANLILAVIIAFVTVAAVKNIPGVLDITLLARLPMTPGARYAVTSLCRYVLIAVGIVMAFAKIGMNFTDLKWLIAALGVGLGFGLQEIVANFVCGLIVLFEQPYRVGDVVTVGDTSGTVTRIQMRATTITDWDRRELIVPNKEFITGKLVNWSLSDPITRIVIPVGVVYGADTALTEQLLLKVARENTLVLEKPEPSAYFLGFGDNSLNFELRVFIQNVLRRFELSDRLHHAIDREFRKAGIVIAFPQRDVHLDTTEALDVRLVTENTPQKDTDPGSGPDRD
ncbi:mechanosensitive ion channel domain-containing protein [Thermodesulfobacteriota bacterium]